MSSEITIKLQGQKELLKKFSDMQQDEIKSDTMFEAAHYLVGWIKDNRLSGARPKYLGVVTGRLRGSIRYSKPEKTGDTWQESISTNVIYAPIHEYGGVIRPKNGKYLVFKVLSSMRFMSLRGNKRLTKPVGNYRWIHTKKVTIPKRPFMWPAIEDESNQQQFLDILSERIQKEWDK